MIDYVNPEGLERLMDAEEELQDAANNYSAVVAPEDGAPVDYDEERAAWRRLRHAAVVYSSAITCLDEGYPAEKPKAAP